MKIYHMVIFMTKTFSEMFWFKIYLISLFLPSHRLWFSGFGSHLCNKGWKGETMLRIKWQIKSKIDIFWKINFLLYFNVHFWISLPLIRCQLVSSNLFLIPGLYLGSDIFLTCPWYACNRIVSWPATAICWILCNHYFIVQLQLYMYVLIFFFTFAIAICTYHTESQRLARKNNESTL